MNTIKALIKKDLYNLSSYKVSIIIVVIFCSLAIISTGSVNYGPIMISTIIGMSSLSTFNYDEISKANKYILTLPVSKKEIILSKYILTISSIIVGGFLGYFLSIVLASTMNVFNENKIDINLMRLLYSTVGGLFGISLVETIQIPSIYKWGAEKGRIQMFAIIFSIIVISAIGFFFITKLNVDITNIKNFLNNYGIIFLIILTMIMYYISYKISYKIYKNKEE